MASACISAAAWALPVLEKSAHLSVLEKSAHLRAAWLGRLAEDCACGRRLGKRSMSGRLISREQIYIEIKISRFYHEEYTPICIFIFFSIQETLTHSFLSEFGANQCCYLMYVVQSCCFWWSVFRLKMESVSTVSHIINLYSKPKSGRKSLFLFTRPTCKSVRRWIEDHSANIDRIYMPLLLHNN